RDALWGDPEKTGHEVIPLGETIFINHVPFTIVGMFQHYEGEQQRKARQFAKLQAAQTPKGRVRRDRGWSGAGRRGGNFVFELKNSTIFIPLNTMWIKFRSGATIAGVG